MVMEAIPRFLKSVIDIASPEVQKMLKEFYEKLQRKAAGSPNPYDDLVVYFFGKILGLEK